ncbi:hypothetical protein L6452_17593 [Arctium lappa]|uniref:Uncharacterized protein n=1 Tax=Arctium lappa TaxID=4217 RepID=A0ACB9C3W3_ARCLA|nr:hypothetical protein L6452_17593 [Arctium lappa]
MVRTFTRSYGDVVTEERRNHDDVEETDNRKGEEVDGDGCTDDGTAAGILRGRPTVPPQSCDDKWEFRRGEVPSWENKRGKTGGDSHHVGGGAAKSNGIENRVGPSENVDKKINGPNIGLLSPNESNEMMQRPLKDKLTIETELSNKYNPENLKAKNVEPKTHLRESEIFMLNDKLGNSEAENRKGISTKCVEKGMEKRGNIEKLKIKRGEGGGFGRGKMGFHMIKQMARSSAQKNGSIASKTTERQKTERSKKMTQLGSEGSS